MADDDTPENVAMMGEMEMEKMGIGMWIGTAMAMEIDYNVLKRNEGRVAAGETDAISVVGT